MNKTVSRILDSTPEEFDSLDKETLPPPLKTIMLRLLGLTNDELQGSPFILICLNKVCQGIQDGGDFEPFLAFPEGHV